MSNASLVVDFSQIKSEERAEHVVRLAGVVHHHVLVKQFDSSQGYRLSSDTYEYPGSKRIAVSGRRSFVRRGILWGFNVDVEPLDDQISRVGVTLYPSTSLWTINFAVGAVAGMMFAGALVIDWSLREGGAARIGGAGVACAAAIAGAVVFVVMQFLTLPVKRLFGPSRSQIEGDMKAILDGLVAKFTELGWPLAEVIPRKRDRHS